MNKLVKENVEDVLKPKTKEDVIDSFEERLEEIYAMDPSDQIDAISEWLEVDQYDAASFIIGNVEPKARNQAIKEIYMFKAEDFIENMDDE